MTDQIENEPDRVTTVLRIEANLTTGTGLKVYPTPFRYDPDFWSTAIAASIVTISAMVYDAAKTDGDDELTPQQVLDGLKAMTSLKVQRMLAKGGPQVTSLARKEDAN